MFAGLLVLLVLLVPRVPVCTATAASRNGDSENDLGSFDWIRKIAAGPAGQKIQLEAKQYLIDKQYQLPRGTELRGVGTSTRTGEDAGSGSAPQTVIKAVGPKYGACAGALISGPKAVQGRKGLLLGDDTYVGGFHFIGMETTRLDCLYAPVETPGTVRVQ